MRCFIKTAPSSPVRPLRATKCCIAIHIWDTRALLTTACVQRHNPSGCCLDSKAGQSLTFAHFRSASTVLLLAARNACVTTGNMQRNILDFSFTKRLSRNHAEIRTPARLLNRATVRATLPHLARLSKPRILVRSDHVASHHPCTFILNNCTAS
jgi:hypothetical protein